MHFIKIESDICLHLLTLQLKASILLGGKIKEQYWNKELDLFIFWGKIEHAKCPFQKIADCTRYLIYTKDLFIC
jgi:hypothetical protein